MNAKKRPGVNAMVATRKSVSKRKFNYASEDRIAELMRVKMKKSSESKVDWAVTAYCDWREDRLKNFNYDAPIYFADILNLNTLEKDNLNHALCRFIPEVTRKRGEGLFLGLHYTNW